jgi:hypothetical protein
MCKSSSATEETSSGGYKVDSVVLRIMMQHDDCICRVTLDNQIKKLVFVGLRKFEGYQSSAPEKADCGLAVDINHIPDMSTGNVIAPIECLVNGTTRHTPLFQKGYLQFRSRIINGDFIRGFCIRIIRGKASLQIVNLKKNHKPIIFVLQPLTINNTSHSLTRYRIIYSSLPHKGHSPYYISTLKKQIIHHQKSPIPNAIRCLSAQKMVYYMKCLVKYIFIFQLMHLNNRIRMMRLPN